MTKGNKSKPALPAWLTYATITLFFATAIAQDSLTGIGLREQTIFSGYDRLSMMGGARLLVKADGGLNNRAGANQMKYRTSQVQGMPTIVGPPLTRDDEFFSNPQEGKLAFTTASVMELFKANFDDFGGSTTLPTGNDDKPAQLTASVTNADTPNQELLCKNQNNCLLQYKRRYTPILHEIIPNQIYKDHKIDWIINIMGVHSSGTTPNGSLPMEELSIDGVLNNWEFTIDTSTRLQSWRLDRLRAVHTNSKPNKSAVPRARFINGDCYFRKTARHCNFAGDDCWNVRTHAKIESVSANQGSTAGGQELTITGWGFEKEKNVSIKVAGLDCAIISQSMEKVKCVTSAATGPSVDGVPQPGQPGIGLREYNPTNKNVTPSYGDLLNKVHPLSKKTVELTFETPYDYSSRVGTIFDGYFKAPETGNYRFYLSCDDACRLSLDSANPLSTSLPFTQTTIAERWWNSGWREYWQPPTVGDSNKYQSDWIALTKGEFYKIDALHTQGGGESHFTVSVEFQSPSKASFAGHPMATKETQILTIDQDNQAETWEVIVTDPSHGAFKLVFQDPVSLLFIPTKEIMYADDSANTFAQRIADPFYNGNVQSSVTVTKTTYDANGVETTDGQLIKVAKYKVQVDKRISSASFASINVLKDPKNKSKIELILPTDLGGLPSTAPLRGNYIINCPNPANPLAIAQTREIAYNEWAGAIEIIVNQDIPFLASKVYVRDMGVPGQKYWENARKFALTFTDLEVDMPECFLTAGVNTPLTGNVVVFQTTTLYDYGKTLMFEPVPMEMLYTSVTKPQILVEVDGVPAACASLNCDYIYVNSPAKVTAMSLSGITLTVTGTNLPTKLMDVRLGDVGCGATSGTPTSITCTLKKKPAAGTYNTVQVLSSDGFVPVDPVTPIKVPLSTVSVTPMLNLNRFGGDVLTITGAGFPKKIENVAVTFNDNTKCVILETSETQLKCKTEKFNTVDTVNPYTVNVSVNAVNAVSAVLDTAQTVKLSTSVTQALGVVPDELSPVLKQDISVTFDAALPADTDLTVWSAFVVGVTVPTYKRQINIVSYDHPTKKMILKFNGAPSGDYRLEIGGPAGLIGGTLTLTTIIAVNSITPSQGSVLGGTLVTLTGGHFGNIPTDNPVKIGDNYCLVESTSDAQIKCRISVIKTQPVATAEVIVFAKTSEEMTCQINAGNGCVFAFTANSTTVTGMTGAFDATTNSIILTVAGTGFLNNDITDTELWIDGFKQKTLSVSNTDATFKLINATTTSSSNIKFYTKEGLASGSIASHSFNPALVRISPSAGSMGGTLLTVTGVGFGKDTINVNIYSSTLNKNICSDVKVTGYGTFTCQTISAEILNTDSLKLVIGNNKYACANTATPANCNLSQMLASSPQLSSVNLSSTDTISFDGSLFPDSAQNDAFCIFQGAKGTGFYTGVNTVSCIFTTGVPAADTPASVYLIFKNKSSSVEQTAFSGSLTLSNPLTISGATLGGSNPCSFAGGCPYTVSGNGIAGALQGNSANSITVCGNTCKFDASMSSSTQATCILPPLATTYSANMFGIARPDVLKTNWKGTGTDMNVLNDGINTKDLIDTTQSSCYAEVQAKEGHIFVIDEVKIFLNNLLDKKPFTNFNLVLKGSQDGILYTDINAYDESIHEGWNSIDWRASNSPQVFRIIRLQGGIAGSCRIGEVKLIGVEVIEDNNTSISCTPVLVANGSTTSLSQVTYSAYATSQLTKITPRFGSERGGESVTFTGVFKTGVATVNIDNRPCTVTSQSAEQITCTTSDKPYVPGNPTLDIQIGDVGSVATFGRVYRYISRWSDKLTWGNDLIPVAGEAVNIPSGRQLLVDVPSTPVLAFVLVEGSLIFESEANELAERTFETGYIMVNGGYVEIGTEEEPYMSKLTITMHGTEKSPYLPTYGNKVLAVRYGTLEMHGKPRSHVWTDLKSTAAEGSYSITINDLKKPLDWAIGEEIVIASTDIDGTHSEQRTITGITTGTNTVISFEEPLQWTHYAGVQTFGGQDIEMRAEVGLLTRNVLYRGDPETSGTNQYGAHIMLHSPGDESAVGKIENCEFYDVGQAFKLGRYPIHFHMIGTVAKSYIKNNSIHQSYNRGTTLHGVHYLEISGNFVYKAMGHTIFIEDAIETKNLIMNNLVMDTRPSNSLLNTDQSPACFWITNPDNIFRGNHCAGSLNYGFWFDLQTTSTGPSFDPNVCPENTKLGEFSDNVAHSAGKYGLRIFHNMVPRTYPCKPLTADPSTPNDPYHNNPVIPSLFYRFIGYKNGRNGAIAERIGAVQFIDFKTADNGLAGIEVSLTEDMIDGYAKVVNSLHIGKSAFGESDIGLSSPHGIIGPRSEGFTIEGAKFFNYNFNEAAALGDCSHCFHPASTDSGARTVTVSGLYFDPTTVPKRIKYQYPFRGIFHDLDDTLTGKGADTYATKGHMHVRQPECVLDEVKYDGVVCSPAVQIRRIAFANYAPDHFRGMPMNILKFDYDQERNFASPDAKLAYINDKSQYSDIFFKEKLKPMNGWAVPFVTGHRYRVSWANNLDFTQMNIQLSERWEPNDKQVQFNIPFIDAREAINVTDTDTGIQIMDKTLLLAAKTHETGTNLLQNETEIREFDLLIHPPNSPNIKRKNLTLLGLQCISGVCPQNVVPVVPVDPTKLYWSQDSSWPSKKKPVAGEDVEILPYMNMILDEVTPILNLVTVNGRLTFLDDKQPIELKAKQVYVRAGELLIGTKKKPFEAQAQITLYGERNEQTLVMDGSIETGNKLLLNTAGIKMFGMPRDRASRLQASVYKGQSIAYVDTQLDWVAGDQVYFAPTNLQWTHSEYRTITDYKKASGKLTLDKPFDWYHYGAGDSTANIYSGVDVRGEVRLLTRNIKIVGAPNKDNWGGNILTSDRMEFDGTARYATTQLSNVEISNCAQKNTFKAAIRFESTGYTGLSFVKNSVVHSSEAWSLYISSSRNILIDSSDFIGAKSVGINLNSVVDVKVNNCFIADVSSRVWTAGDNMLDKEACVAFCSYWEPNRCSKSSVTNSIATGCVFAGFIAPGNDCSDTTSTKFRNNVAHSNQRVGAHIYPDPSSSQSGACYEGSNFSAYKNRDGGLTTMYSTADLRMRDMVFIDNQNGVCLQAAGERELVKISMKNVEIYGEGENNDCPEGQACYCPNKFGLMLFGANFGGKPLHPTMASQLPVHKIKSYGSWGGQITLDGVNFNNFQSGSTSCGARQTLFQRNPYASDYIPIHKIKNSIFTNVAEEAFIWIEDPDPSWANPTDCIEWPCTAPNNIVMQFEGAKFRGTVVPVRNAPTFQVVSDVQDAVKAYANSSCMIRDYWNAAYCTNINLGILLFESLDADTEDRTVQPVKITNAVSKYSNTVNSYMDHGWDGFYTSQKRLSRFPVQIETVGDYTVKMTGTPPQAMRFALRGDQGGIKINIPYPNAGSYAVMANGVEKPYTPWDKALGRHSALTKTQGCGENRYVGVENFLEFFLTPGCDIKIVPKDSIMCSVRLDWTLEQFYAAGGVDTFADRMAAVLGVHASQIKTVAVYKGSVIIQFFVSTLKDDKNPEKTKDKISQKFIDAVASGTLKFGAPVIDAMAGSRVVKTGYIGDHVQKANLWDNLIPKNPTNPVYPVNPVTPTKPVNPTDPVDSSKNNSTNTSGGSSSLTPATVVTDEITTSEMSDSVKYLIIFLSVLAIVLIIVIAYVAMRMWSRRHAKPQRLPSDSKLEPQFVAEASDAKEIFSGRRRKQIAADHLGETTSAGPQTPSRTTSSQMELRLPDMQNTMQLTTENSAPETARHMQPSQR